MPRPKTEMKPEPIAARDYPHPALFADYLAAQDRGDEAALNMHRRHLAVIRWQRELGARTTDVDAQVMDTGAAVRDAYSRCAPIEQIEEAAVAHADAKRLQEALRAAGPNSARGLVGPSHDPVEHLHTELVAGAARRKWVTGSWALEQLKLHRRGVEDNDPHNLPDGLTVADLDAIAEPTRRLRADLATAKTALAELGQTRSAADHRRRAHISDTIARLERRLRGEPAPAQPQPNPDDDQLVFAGSVTDHRSHAAEPLRL